MVIDVLDKKLTSQELNILKETPEIQKFLDCYCKGLGEGYSYRITSAREMEVGTYLIRVKIIDDSGHYEYYELVSDPSENVYWGR